MPKTINLPSYEQLEKTFESNKRNCIPSELHGYLCGVICGNKNSQNKEQLKLVLNRLKEEDLETALNKKILAKIMLITFKQLQDQNYQLKLILPDDETKIEQRLKALSKWCQGFLSGLGDSGLTEKDIEQRKLNEALDDIFAITGVYNASKFNVKNNEETYYLELAEHVKIIAILFFTENVLNNIYF